MRRRRADGASAERIVWVAGITMIVLFVGAFVYAYFGKHGAARIADSEPASRSLAMTSDAAQYAVKDTDGDGVADWEELLWGTDINNPDTDGDGVSDGGESRVGPTVDDLATVVAPGELSQDVTNATQVAARELLGSYLMQVRGAYIDLSEADQDLLVSQTIDSAVNAYMPPTVSDAELSIVPATNKSRAVYILKVADTVLSMGQKEFNDYNLLMQLPTDIEGVTRTSLHQSAQQTAAGVEGLKTIDVPEDAVGVHVNLVNAFLGYVATLENIAAIKEDPLRAVIGSSMLLEYDAALKVAVLDFRNYGNAWIDSQS